MNCVKECNGGNGLAGVGALRDGIQVVIDLWRSPRMWRALGCPTGIRSWGGVLLMIGFGLAPLGVPRGMWCGTVLGEETSVGAANGAPAEGSSSETSSPKTEPEKTEPAKTEPAKPEPDPSKPAPPAVPIVAMSREEAEREGKATYALIIVGHPGDAAFAAEFDKAADQMRAFLREQLAVPEEQIRQLSSATMAKPDDQPAVPPATTLPVPATREAIRALVDAEKQRIPAEATVWVIVMGHAHIDGRGAALNLPGRDLLVADLAQWLHELPGQRQVVWLTQPLSGYAVQTLKRPGRVVIAATEADVELNGTILHQALGETLATAVADIDHDGDGRLTLLDLYVEVNRDVARRYAANMALPTEHAQLDDNGDGAGTELQVDYLTPEFGGRRGDQPPSPRVEGRDGFQASRWQLPLRRPEPPKSDAPATETPPKPAAEE